MAKYVMQNQNFSSCHFLAARLILPAVWCLLHQKWQPHRQRCFLTNFTDTRKRAPQIASHAYEENWVQIATCYGGNLSQNNSLLRLQGLTAQKFRNEKQNYYGNGNSTVSTAGNISFSSDLAFR